MTSTMIVEYSDAILAVLNQSREAFEREARLAMAAKLYELGRMSSGQAAKLAGISRVEFLVGCGRLGVPSVAWDESELDTEYKAL